MPALGRLRQENYLKFEANLDHSNDQEIEGQLGDSFGVWQKRSGGTVSKHWAEDSLGLGNLPQSLPSLRFGTRF